MWRAVLIHKKGGVLPLGAFSSWESALGACIHHVGTITPGQYRLDEVGVDRLGEGLVFAVLEHPMGGWIANAIGPEAGVPSAEEVEASLAAWGLEKGRWVWVVEENLGEAL